jgi:hypothetical protein
MRDFRGWWFMIMNLIRPPCCAVLAEKHFLVAYFANRLHIVRPYHKIDTLKLLTLLPVRVRIKMNVFTQSVPSVMAVTRKHEGPRYAVVAMLS